MNAKVKAQGKYLNYLLKECNQNSKILNSNQSVRELKKVCKIFKMIAKEKS